MNPTNPMFDMFGSSSTPFGGGGGSADTSRPTPMGDQFDMGRGGRPSEDPFLMQKRPIGTNKKILAKHLEFLGVVICCNSALLFANNVTVVPLLSKLTLEESLYPLSQQVKFSRA